MSRPSYDLEKAWCEHVCYEATMLDMVSKVVCSSHGPAANALVESRAIHLRNLLDFLAPKQVKPDDIVATDYLSTWSCPLPAELWDAREACNKEIAHLTTKRLEAKMVWRPELVQDALELFREFCRQAGRSCPVAG